jgi:hypothetical protein
VTAVFGSAESDRTRPSPAEIARTVIASAGAGCLTTYPRTPAARPQHTQVALEPDVEGLPTLQLDPRSPAVRHLLSRPVATLRVAPAGRPAVRVHVGVQRLPANHGSCRYRVEVLAVRLAMPHWQAVPVAQYHAAVPDPLRHDAPEVLRHLASHHGSELTACLRALGHDTRWAEPRALDRRGLDVLSVDDDGVQLVRLPFPEPVNSLRDLSTGLAAPLLCRCQRDASTQARD